MFHSRKPTVSRVFFVFAFVITQIASLFVQPFELNNAIAQTQSASVASGSASTSQATDCSSNKGFRLSAADQTKLAQLQNAAGGQLRISCHSTTGKVRFIGGQSSAPVVAAATTTNAPASAEQIARDFLGAYGDLFGLRNPATDLVLEKVVTSDRGSEAVRFQQVYNGASVIGGEITVQLGAKREVLAVGGEVLPDLNLSTVAALTDDQARLKAQTLIAKKYSLPANILSVRKPELSVYNSGLLDSQPSTHNRLVWKTVVFAAPGRGTDGNPVEEFVLIDAQTGAIALNFAQVEFAKDRRVCNLNNTPVGDNIPDCTTPVRSEGQPATNDSDVDSAYDLAGDTYDFYKNYFNRDSLNGTGLPLKSTVRLCFEASDCPYVNAFWLDELKQMYYGQGFAVADDVVGHELTHGFTSFTSNLYYYFQSGAINESLSDVFGEFTDQLNNRDGSGGTDASKRWLLGEDLPASIGVIRNMKNPPAFGDPDRVGSTNYHVITNTGSLAFDNGGVHTNSGVNNKASYLMTDGDVFNGYTITGLGITKTAQIYYEVATKLLSTASDYQDMYDYLPQACRNLIGQLGITQANCLEVEKVVAATQMNLAPSNALAEAPVCPAGFVPSNLFYDNFDNPTSSAWVSTTTVPAGAWKYINYYTPNPGGLSIVGPNLAVVSESSLSMSSNVNALPAQAYLYLRHSVGLESGSGTVAYDGGVIEYSVNDGGTWQPTDTMFTHNGYRHTVSGSFGNPLANRKAFSAGTPFISSRLDLNSLAGQSVRFRFRVGNDSEAYFDGWTIEEVRVYTCQQVAVGNSSVVLNQSSATTSFGQVVTFTANITPMTATGVVTFSTVPTNNVVGIANVNAGVATLVRADLPVGQNVLKATYGGDVSLAGSVSSNITHEVTAGGVCSPLVVTLVSDDGTGTTCGTLSHALSQPAQQPLIITFALASGNTITFSGPLNVALKAGVTLQGKLNCSDSAAAIVINGNGQAGGLTLVGNNVLRGLVIKGFSGPEIKVAAGTGGNRIECSMVKHDAN